MSRLPTKEIQEKYKEINEKLASVADQKDLIELSKQQKKLFRQDELASKIEKLEKEITENTELLETLGSDEQELIDLTKEDNVEKEIQLQQAEEELLSYLSPSDPKDDNNVILEIRAGAGGDEASLFASEMLRAYTRMCDELGFKVKVISSSENPLGGFKEVMAEIIGDGVYSWFKYEGGVHRVQRVPLTEKQGRVHTSTVSMAVMPLIEKDDNDFKLNMDEVEVITTTSSGNGGQSVNTTYSAIKAKHLPTGIEAQCQDERSQLQNKEKALTVLASRVFDHYEQKRLAEETAERRSQVGNADRSEKIRTYNFPQDRLTDHRYSRNWNQLPLIMSGKILEVIQDIKKMEAERVLEGL